MDLTRSFYIQAARNSKQVHFQLGNKISTYLNVLRRTRRIIKGLQGTDIVNLAEDSVNFWEK